MHREDNHFILDKDYWLLKEEQCTGSLSYLANTVFTLPVSVKQVLPNLDYVGWYTVSDEYLNTDDLDLQNQVRRDNLRVKTNSDWGGGGPKKIQPRASSTTLYSLGAL